MQNLKFYFFKFWKKSKKLEIISSNIAASFIQDTAKYKIEIFTDLFYDLIEFCLVKGFSLLEIVRCCSIFYELLEHTKQTSILFNFF